MAPGKALAQLALQKRFLVAESEARRLVLASELHRIGKSVAWADWVSARLRSIMVVGGPLAGFWFMRRSRGVKRWAAIGWGTMRLAQTARRLLRRLRAR